MFDHAVTFDSFMSVMPSFDVGERLMISDVEGVFLARVIIVVGRENVWKSIPAKISVSIHCAQTHLVADFSCRGSLAIYVSMIEGPTGLSDIVISGTPASGAVSQ